jgi:hypothetical protein
MVELLVGWGIATMIISQPAAIVWQIRSFSRAPMLRNLVCRRSSIC